MLEYFQIFYVQQTKGPWCLISDLFYVLLLNLLFLPKPFQMKDVKKTIVRFFFSYALLLLTASAYYTIILDDKYLFMATYSLFTLEMMFLMKERKTTSRLVMGSVYYVVQLFSLGITQGLDVLRLSDDLYPPVTMAFRILMVLCAVLFMRRFSVEEVEQISLHTILLIELSCVMTFLIFFYYTKIRMPGHSETDNLMMLVYLAFFVIVLTAYYMFRGIAQNIEEIATLRNQNLLMELETGRVEVAEEAMEEMRKTRHDIKNHLRFVNTLLGEARYEDARRYLGDVTDSVEHMLSYIDCGNKNINAILNYEKGRAEKIGIRLCTDVVVPKQLPFTEMDMCSLLCNLLENAIEACQSERMVDAAVDVNLRVNGDYFLARVVNPMPKGRPKQVRPNLETTKANKENHGYGVKIVRSIAEKYSGYAMFKVEGQLFVADVMLDMKAR